MLSRSIRPYTTVCDEVYVVVRPNDDIVRNLNLNLRAIEAPKAELGMGHSLATAASKLQDAAWILVGLADMPWIKKSTIEAIKDRLDTSTNAIVRPVCAQQPGHPVGFTGNFIPEIAQLEGDEGAKNLVKKYRDRVIEIEVADSGILRDIDEPDQLKSSN